MNNLLNKKKIFKDINLLKKNKDKLIYLIELGKILPFKNKNIRNKKNIIYGCQSNIWLKIKIKNNIIKLNGDSNSYIIKGILLIIIIILNNKNIIYIENNINKIIKKIYKFKKILNYKIIGFKSIILYLKKKINNNIY